MLKFSGNVTKLHQLRCSSTHFNAEKITYYHSNEKNRRFYVSNFQWTFIQAFLIIAYRLKTQHFSLQKLKLAIYNWRFRLFSYNYYTNIIFFLIFNTTFRHRFVLHMAFKNFDKNTSLFLEEFLFQIKWLKTSFKIGNHGCHHPKS